MRTEKLAPVLSGALAACLGLAVMLPAIFKFGGFFAIRGDYVNQTITRLITAKYMLSGGSLPLWNWKNFLGTAYTGAFSTLFSLNSICMLFPARLIPFAATLVLLLRWFVAGVTSFLVIRRFVKKDSSAMLGSLMYCFSGYAFAALEFSAFFAALAVFPLLILAVEMRFCDNKRYLMIPAAALNLLASTYLFIGSSIALLIYSIIRFFTAEEWRHNRRASQVLLCLLEYFIGVLICGPKLLGFTSSMLSTARAEALIGENTSSANSFVRMLLPIHLFDEIAALFIPAASNRVTAFFRYTNWYSMQACLPVFGFGLCAAALLKKRFFTSMKAVFIAMLVFSAVPLFNNVTSFYGNGYTRWWYALVLVMAIISAGVFDSADEPELNKPLRAGVIIQWTAVILVPLVFYAVYLLRDTGSMLIKRIIAVFFVHDYSFGFAEDVFRIFVIASAVLFTAALSCLVFIKKLRRFALPIVAVCIALYGAAFTALNNSDSPMFRELFCDPKTDKEYKSLSTLVDKYYGDDKIVGGAPYSFRVDHPDIVINYSAVIDQPTISFFESTIDSDAVAFAEFAGMGNSKNVSLSPHDDSNALRTLLSVRYYYNCFPDDESIAIPKGFDFAYRENGVDVYENEYFIPFGFAYDSYITESELYAMQDASVETLLHTLVVEDGAEEYVSRYLPHCDLAAPDPQADISARLECAPRSFAGDSEGFTAEFDTDSERVVFFSVPFDEGWRLDIDGEPCRVFRAGIGFMGVVIPEGSHTVHAVYRNTALYYGVGATALGIAAALVYVLLTRKKRESGHDEKSI